MGIIIREAELPADREILLDILLRNRDSGDHALRQARFEWSLSCNPYGQPRAWLAIDESSGRIIGSVSAFPRRLLVDGKPALAWNGGDTSIDREFRTLGAAIKLRRVVKECVDRGEMRFLYSHPVDRMAAVLEKIGHVVAGRLARHSVMLRADRIVNNMIGENFLASLLAHASNPLLRAWSWPENFSQRHGVAVHVQEQNHFGDEFDALFERVAPNYRVIAVRDAKFLSWRFLQNPLHREFRIFRLEAGTSLRGYAIVDFQGDGARILDFLVENHNNDWGILLGGVIRRLRPNGICSVSVRANEHNPMLQRLRSFGPTALDATNSSFAIHAPAEGPDQVVRDARNWFMTQADRDV
ncbi:MAG: hypothetical protein ONB46_02670 [candidate division KSB1 bacterium]|nr:hypothetical protein [candidate division KSB1 bacterium]MDZ7364861.1 hypothetical protein [candidate division KSB1 bacterium]MDZ7402964.1 hypothetical protein [candidate division KSB1 bacterium]